MHFMTVLIFSTLVLSMILVIIDGISSNTYTHSDANNVYNINIMNDVGDARDELLLAKRRESDGPTILAYIMILAAIIIPNMPQID